MHGTWLARIDAAIDARDLQFEGKRIVIFRER